MTEEEYMDASNRAKITIALNILRDCLPLTAIEHETKVMGAIETLRKIEKSLFGSIEKQMEGAADAEHDE